MARNTRQAAPRWDPGRGCWRLQVRWSGGPPPHSREWTGATAEAVQEQADQWRAEQTADGEARRVRERLAAAGFVLPEAATSSATTRSAISFADAAQRFLRWLPTSEAAPTTTYAYQRAMERVLIDALPLRLDQITPSVVDALRTTITSTKSARTGKPLSAREYLICLSACCSWAVREGLIPSNPCHRPRGLYRPGRAQQEAKPQPVALTRDERRRLLEAMPTKTDRQIRYRVAARLGAWCGLRPGEVLAAGEDQLREDVHGLLVDRQLSQTPGTGWAERQPKHGSTGITVCPPCVLAELEPVRARARRRGLRWWLAQDDGTPQEWQCPDHGLKLALRKAAREAEVRKTVTPQVLRATAFSCWLDAGIPAATAEAWLRHGVTGMSGVGRDHYWRGWDPDAVDVASLD